MNTIPTLSTQSRLCGMQKLSTAEQVFIAITSPLTWARTQLTSAAARSALQLAQGELSTSNIQAFDAHRDIGASLDITSYGQADGAAVSDFAETVSATHSMISLTAADSDRRKPAACARSVLEAERIILAAANKYLKTYVICPGILYGGQHSTLVCCS